jgi:tRNA(Ile)-lysidine synthase
VSLSAGSPGPAPEATRLAASLLARCAFPPAGTPVVAAVSGGADSLALMLLAHAAGLPTRAVHVDHGLRPESGADADSVRRAAATIGVEVTVRRVIVPPGPNLEARARAARYAALPPGVLVAHTADDQAETMLLNLLRGAGVHGLAAMAAPAAGRRVQRPLLGLRRSETQRLCAAAGWRPVDDESNRDLRFRRNQVRWRLLPLMAEVGRRDPVPVLARQGRILADDAALLDELAAGLDVTDARALAGAHPALARRAVRRWLRAGSDDEHHPPSAAEVERVLAVARGDAVGCELSGGRRVRRRANRLRLEPPAPAEWPAAPLFP